MNQGHITLGQNLPAGKLSIISSLFVRYLQRIVGGTGERAIPVQSVVFRFDSINNYRKYTYILEPLFGYIEQSLVRVNNPQSDESLGKFTIGRPTADVSLPIDRRHRVASRDFGHTLAPGVRGDRSEPAELQPYVCNVPVASDLAAPWLEPLPHRHPFPTSECAGWRSVETRPELSPRQPGSSYPQSKTSHGETATAFGYPERAEGVAPRNQASKIQGYI